MTVPYSLLIIKPLSVGRGDAPKILGSILEDCPVALRMFRSWSICDTTLFGLTSDNGSHPSTLDYETESIHPPRHINSWIMIFTHKDRQTDPTQLLNDYCGPLNPSEWLPEHLRYTYGGFTNLGLTAHPSDTVVHIATPERVMYESGLVFLGFDETLI